MRERNSKSGNGAPSSTDDEASDEDEMEEPAADPMGAKELSGGRYHHAEKQEGRFES